MDYQKAFGVSKPTASRDLEDMLRKGILEKIGTTGKGTHYVLNRKGLTKGSKGSSPGTRAMAHKRSFGSSEYLSAFHLPRPHHY